MASENGAKNNLELQKFIHEKKFLLVDSSPITRNTFKKILLSFGADHKLIFVAENLKLAEKILEDEKPEFISLNIEGTPKNLESFYKRHYELFPNRLRSGFCLIADKENIEMNNFVLENEIDFVIHQPFTSETVETTLKSALLSKVAPGPYLCALHEGKEYFARGSFDKARQLFDHALTLDSAPHLVLTLLGELAFALKNYDEARLSFETSLIINKESYRALKGLADSCYELKDYNEAYRFQNQLVEQFPFNSNRIPRLTRLAVLTKKYDEIYHYGKMFVAMKGKIPCENLVSVAAGLVISGKKLITQNSSELQTQGIDALYLSSKLACGKKAILESIVQTFIEVGKAKEALKLLDEYSDESVNTEDLLLLQFEAMNEASADPMPVLELGNNLMTKKIRTKKVYKVMIERSLQAKRAQNAIEILIQNARKDFPDCDCWDHFISTQR